MKTLEGEKARYSIFENNVYLGDTLEERCEDILEAEDYIEDEAVENLKRDHTYVCYTCNMYLQESEVRHRIEDSSFRAPYGEVFVLGGDVASVPVCPICDDDLEDT